MELILKTGDEKNLAKIIKLAKKLNVTIERCDWTITDKEKLKNRILNFKAKGPSSFGDAANWQCNERSDRDIF